MKTKFKNFIEESKNVYILKHGNDFITYLNTNNFIISNNYYGLLAIGERNYNYNNKTVEIEYKIINDEIITKYNVEFLIKKYEKLLNTENILINEIK